MSRRFASLRQQVATHICYAQIFDDAFTTPELVERCAPDDPSAVVAELRSLEREGRVEMVDGYWFLSGLGRKGHGRVKSTGQGVVREVMRENATLLDLLARLPVARLVAVSGSLARDHVAPRKEPDLDLFVITSPSAVHIVRMIVRGAELLARVGARLGLTPRHRLPCLNYTTECGFLEVTNPSFYTATDIFHLKILKDRGIFASFLAANPWLARYYPVPRDEQVHLGVQATREDAPEGAHLLLAVLNVLCFAIMGGLSWAKALCAGRPHPYALRFRYDKMYSLRRGASGGGGFQPRVAQEFERIYARHFGADPSLQQFLFPGTTTNGIELEGRHYLTTTPLELLR